MLLRPSPASAPIAQPAPVPAPEPAAATKGFRASTLRIKPLEFEPLTARENETLVLVAGALTDAEIAVKLGVSVETVKRHTGAIRSKLGLHNRVSMALYAVREGLVTP